MHVVDFDANDLLMAETRDALGNRVTVDANDYRVLQPRLVSDPNGNRPRSPSTRSAWSSAPRSWASRRRQPAEGDSLAGFVADLTQAQLDAFFDAADPHAERAGPAAETPPRASSTTSIASAAPGRRIPTTRPSGSRPAPRRSRARPTSARRCRRTA